MKLKDVREIERHLKVLEAHERIERDNIKGLAVTVIFDGAARPGDAPVQLFIPEDHADFSKLFVAVSKRIGEVRAASDEALTKLKAKFAESK